MPFVTKSIRSLFKMSVLGQPSSIILLELRVLNSLYFRTAPLFLVVCQLGAGLPP